MPQFPVNRRGYVCVYPFRSIDQYSTQVVRTPDFTTETFTDLSAPLKRWELRWDAMTDEDYETWHQFIREVGGRGGQFTFIDPSENLLQHTEDFSNAVWLKGTDLVVGKNYLTKSEEFEHADWVRNAVLSVSADSQTAPDDTTTADRVTPTVAGPSTHLVQTPTAPPSVASEEFIFSVWLRAASGTPSFVITIRNDAFLVRGTTVAGPTTSWQRFEVTATMDAGDTGISVFIGGSNTWTNADGPIDIWGGQLEYGSVVSDYTSTTTAAVDLQIADPDFVANPGYPDNLNSATPKRGQVLVNTSGSDRDMSQQTSSVNVAGVRFANSVYVKTPTGTSSQDLILRDRLIVGGLINETFTEAYSANTSWQRIENNSIFSQGNNHSIIDFTVRVTAGDIVHLFGPQLEATSIVSAYKKNTSLSALHAKCRFAADSLPRSLTSFDVSQLRKIVIEEFI